MILGGERQVEVFAAQWARQNKVQVYAYPPNWRRYGRGAASQAGKQMLKAMFDHKMLLVFPAALPSSYIKALIRQAEKAKIEVVRKKRQAISEQAVPVQV